MRTKFLIFGISHHSLQGFPYWGMTWGVSPPTSRKFAHSPPVDFPHKKSIPPTKQQFPSYNPIKTAFLAVVIASIPFFNNFILFGYTGHVNFDFN